MSLYIFLSHGRTDPDEQLDEWGVDGPTLGPFKYIHCTYASNLEVKGDNGELSLYIINEMLYYDGVYYGDWEIHSSCATPVNVEDSKTKPPGKNKYSTLSEDGTEFSWNNSSIIPDKGPLEHLDGNSYKLKDDEAFANISVRNANITIRLDNENADNDLITIRPKSTE